VYSPNLTTWRAQYHRLKRGLEKLRRPYRSSTEYEDDLQHYLQDCWHLKDWIKNDQSTSASGLIENEVAAHRALRVVADLANGAKHFTRTTHREGAYVTSSSVTVHLAQDKPIDVEYIVTLADGTTLTASSLVTDSFDAWSQVLARLGLDP